MWHCHIELNWGLLYLLTNKSRHYFNWTAHSYKQSIIVISCNNPYPPGFQTHLIQLTKLWITAMYNRTSLGLLYPQFLAHHATIIARLKKRKICADLFSVVFLELFHSTLVSLPIKTNWKEVFTAWRDICMKKHGLLQKCSRFITFTDHMIYLLLNVQMYLSTHC